MGRSAKSWLVAASAIAYLCVMFLAGELPRHGHYHESRAPAGLLAATPEAVQTVTLETPAVAVRLLRRASGWEHASGIPLTPEAVAALEDALRYTHSAPPVRELADTDDEAGLRSMGLLPPRLSIVVDAADGSLLHFSLGARNTDGVLRYARRGDSGTVLLLSGFLGDAWYGLADLVLQTATGAPSPGKHGDAAVQRGIRAP